jgi:O-succinylhomoserine sulfhydrylase
MAVDNCFASPALQQPAKMGADFIIHSGTKYLDGQGRVIAGAICASAKYVDGVFTPVMRTVGMSLSPFNAWVVLKGMETLSVRMKAQTAGAGVLAAWLESHPAIERVYYPGLKSHPQHELAMRQQGGQGGAVVSFIVKSQADDKGRAAAFHVIDQTRICSITANLGDTKTTITHPATTSHGRLAPQEREAAGIRDSLIRVAVGLEDVGDLQADLARGLAAL